MKKNYHFSIESVLKKEFVIKADSTEDADIIAREMFNDRDNELWNGLNLKTSRSEKLVYEGFSTYEDSVLLAADANERVTVQPEEKMEEASCQ